MAKDVEVIWLRSEPKYFCEGGWTGGGETASSGSRQMAARSKPQCPGHFRHLPAAKCWPRAAPLFFRYGVALFDQSVELLLLLSNPLRRSFFILRAGGPGGLFDQLPQIVPQYRDTVVEFR
jgi:hypothetical protein